MSTTAVLGQGLWLPVTPSPSRTWTTSDTAAWTLTVVCIRTEDENHFEFPEGNFHEN